MIDDTINRLIDARRSLLRSIAELDSLLEEAALSAVSHNVAWEPHKGVQESSRTPTDAPPKKAVVERSNPAHVSWRRPVRNLPVIGGHDFTPYPKTSSCPALANTSPMVAWYISRAVLANSRCRALWTSGWPSRAAPSPVV